MIQIVEQIKREYKMCSGGRMVVTFDCDTRVRMKMIRQVRVKTIKKIINKINSL